MKLRHGTRFVRAQVLQVERPDQVVRAPDVLGHQMDLNIKFVTSRLYQTKPI